MLKPPGAARAVAGGLAVVVVLALFCAKYMSAMMQQNAFWRSGAWYEFLTRPSAASQAALLDPTAMTQYSRTLSISFGHQTFAALSSWGGFDAGTALLYVVIARILTAGIYLVALHSTPSPAKAFAITVLMLCTDLLALAHIGALRQRRAETGTRLHRGALGPPRRVVRTTAGHALPSRAAGPLPRFGLRRLPPAIVA
ncbi:MAG TPA: hypothetical protein VFB20_02055 [Burkholderiales bacterium]|nr:hypothetical protein [Burkholderiales bacterium]